ncbi:hypothetical protein [Mucilaginibacter kameinonensis]|uniref:hypothetical protein n=1 Tax=Mucilaginibacter kameinonensis TaxID=452286 RepID=UPI000EF832F5|nr:hypothetical protein [Mucilaginibacter kameinonensis]
MHNTFTVEIPKLFSNELYRRVLISNNGITIEIPQIQNLVSTPSDELIAFRYGVKGIRGYAFTIGRHYFIEIKTARQDAITIKFSSYYGFRKKIYRKAWIDIVNKLWDYHFVNHYLSHYNRYKNGESFEFCGMTFQEGTISWDNKNILPYAQVGLGNYVNYFMVYHKENKSQQKSYNFRNDWNALALQSLLKTIVKEHQSAAGEITSDIHP